MTRRAVARSAVLGAGAAFLFAGGGGVARAAGDADGVPSARTANGASPRDPDGFVLELPAPTGPYRLGATTLYLVDTERNDPWVDKTRPRELMISVFYPAHTVRGYPVAPQMTPDAAAVFEVLDTTTLHRELPDTGVAWAATRTHAHTGAPALPVRRPVLLYTPGGGDPRTLGTGVAEELASHGHVVVTIDHPGDASEVDFPHKPPGPEKIRTTVFRDDPRTNPRLFRTMIETRIADTRFVLDQLEALAAGRNPDATGHPLPRHLGRALDLRRVGVYGHSAGGTTAAQTLYDDDRVSAAVNIEGFLDHPPQAPGQEGELFPVARDGVDRPLLLLGSSGFLGKRELERSWSAALAHSGGHAHRREVGDADHWTFTDYGALVPQLQAAGLMTADERKKMVGTIEPAVSVPLVRGYMRGFFIRHLRRR
ncbi:alpha/beta hydrolase [Streptomyces sp. NPDC003077]|uniref:alpha/beta hydrolase n=1 Tax=Streptomyces sp. NPDC003077 TaxID=3154443 RepID=UPI0033B81585